MTETVSISIEEWLALSREGTKIPVEITLAGTSMEPLIRKGRDTVRIEPLEEELCPGDIVLFKRADGAYVVHRVFGFDGKYVITLGDNCEKKDAPIPPERVLGKVTMIKRGGREIDPDSGLWRSAGIFGMKLLPLRKRALHMKWVLKKNFKR